MPSINPISWREAMWQKRYVVPRARGWRKSTSPLIRMPPPIPPPTAKQYAKWTEVVLGRWDTAKSATPRSAFQIGYISLPFAIDP